MGNLYVVATPIGNLLDITKRAEETLNKVDIILCEDTRTSLKLLNHLNIKNKLVSYHKFNEQEKAKSIIEDLKEGKNIALISDAGTPCISDPGYVLIKEARNNNINIIPIGGISAVITALSISGLNTDSFSFHGFFPRETKDKNKLIKEIEISNIKTHVIYESPKRIGKTLEFLSNNLEIEKVSISRELTKLHETTYYGSIENVIKEIKEDKNSNLGEYTLVIEKKQIKKEETNLTIEALLIDEIVNNEITLKEAIDNLNKKYDNLSKKDIYNASLNLKNLKI